MSNIITIELCAEDRARLDRLAEALERRTCDKCVTAAVDYLKAAATPTGPKPETIPAPTQQTPINTLAEANENVEASKNSMEEAETSTITTEPLKKEEEPTKPEPTKMVTREELKAKVIKMCAKGLKDQTRDIVRGYAQTVTAVPDDKIAECYAALEALEA